MIFGAFLKNIMSTVLIDRGGSFSLNAARNVVVAGSHTLVRSLGSSDVSPTVLRHQQFTRASEVTKVCDFNIHQEDFGIIQRSGWTAGKDASDKLGQPLFLRLYARAGLPETLANAASLLQVRAGLCISLSVKPTTCAAG